MWTHPKCAREFRKTNQDHHCGKAPETMEYFLQQTKTDSGKKNGVCFPYDKELPAEIITNTGNHSFQNKEEAGK